MLDTQFFTKILHKIMTTSNKSVYRSGLNSSASSPHISLSMCMLHVSTCTISPTSKRNPPISHEFVHSRVCALNILNVPARRAAQYQDNMLDCRVDWREWQLNPGIWIKWLVLTCSLRDSVSVTPWSLLPCTWEAWGPRFRSSEFEQF